MKKLFELAFGHKNDEDMKMRLETFIHEDNEQQREQILENFFYAFNTPENKEQFVKGEINQLQLFKDKFTWDEDYAIIKVFTLEEKYADLEKEMQIQI
mgnify:CR=1 FL=1